MGERADAGIGDTVESHLEASLAKPAELSFHLIRDHHLELDRDSLWDVIYLMTRHEHAHRTR